MDRKNLETSQIQRIGLLGTGLMGQPMALRLLDQGQEVMVYNRTPSRIQALQQQGVLVGHTVSAVIDWSEAFITMLTDYSVISQVLFSSKGVQFKNKLMIQMGTISPQESQLLQGLMEEADAEYVEAPVLGSIPQAADGTLFILFGGLKEQYHRCESIFSALGRQTIHFGSVGRAAAAKLAFNQLIATLTTAFSMSLGYLREKEVDIDAFMDILRQSALYAPTFDKKFTRMMERNFGTPNFPLKHLLKDVELIRRDFADVSIDVSAINGIEELIRRAIQLGNGELDYSSLYNAVHPERAS